MSVGINEQVATVVLSFAVTVFVSLLWCVQRFFHFKLQIPTEIPSRSQWPRSLRHELPSLPQTLGSWVRIPLETWTCVCAYSVFVLSCV
jgi:hypothetical protein